MRLHGERNIDKAIGPFGHLRLRRLQIIERDLLKQIGDQVLMFWAGFFAEQGDQIARARIRRAAERMRRQEPRQRPVDLFFANQVLQQIHHQRALAVVNIGLVFDTHQRQFLQRLAPARAQIRVELKAQEAADLILAIGFFHHHQRRILRQGFRRHGAALLIAADHLVRPPLMGDLMRGHVIGVIDILGLAIVGDEADRFGIGHGAGKGLRKAGIGREFQHAGIVKLIGTKIGAVIIERVFHRLHHSSDVIIMRLVIIYRQVNIVPAVLGDFITG